jgi:hypothetical protein
MNLDEMLRGLGAIVVVCTFVLAVVSLMKAQPPRVHIPRYAEALGLDVKDPSRCEGTLNGRPVCIQEIADDHALSFEIGVSHPPAIQVTRDGLMGMIGRVFGATIPSGDRGFDGRFVVTGAGDRSRAKAALADGFREVVKRIFDGFGVTLVHTIRQPFLYQDRHLFAGRSVLRARVPRLDPKRAPELFAKLGELASFLEGVPLHVVTLGAERRAEKGASGSPRCAWCHADITGSEPDLVACEKCATVLHEACWAEQGGCPVMGCAGKTAERAKQRGNTGGP